MRSDNKEIVKKTCFGMEGVALSKMINGDFKKRR